MLPHLFTQTHTSDTVAGTLTVEWAEKLGLPEGIAVAVGALDAHMGAVGASVATGVLTRIIGTSTCDIMVAEKTEIGNRCIKGICGQVDGSVLPGFIGFEAGQSAFGDIYAWFKKILAWPLKNIPDGEEKQKVLDGMLVELTCEAQAVEPSEDSVVALDWMNGRRTPDADQNVKGAIAGLTLGSTAPEVFRALVEATAFGSRRIVEHMKGQGLRIDSVNAIGGISKKAPFVMQTLADVLDMPIRVVRSEQTCALGAAMFAAVAAGIYPDKRPEKLTFLYAGIIDCHMFSRIFAEHPVCYALLFTLLDAVFGGITGLVAMCFARWCGSRFSTIMAPFALYVFTGVMFEGRGIGTWSAMQMVNPLQNVVTYRYQMVTMYAAVSAAALVLIYIWHRRRDIL